MPNKFKMESKVIGQILWWVFYLAFALCLSRLIWEMTNWTWERGPQMVGFSIMHGSYGLYFIIGLMGGYLLALIGIIKIIINLFKKNKFSITNNYRNILILFTQGIGLIPYSVWMYLTILVAGPGNEPYEMLRYSSGNGYYNVAELLLSKGVDPNDINSELYNNIESNDPFREIMEEMHAKAKNEWGIKPALTGAASSGQLEIVKLLLENGANINLIYKLSGNTALIEAVQNDYFEIVKILKENNADVTIKNIDGKMAINYVKSDDMKTLFPE